MTGRFVCLVAGIAALLASASTASAQAPPGYAPMYQGDMYSGGYPGGPGMGNPQYPPQYQPLTPDYMQGGAGYAWDDLSGDDGFLYEDTPLDRFFQNVASDTYFRVEAMIWQYKEPGDRPLGSPVQGVIDPRTPFPVTVSGQNVGEARVASLVNVNLEQISGIKGTLGIPLARGVVEANIFSFQNTDEFTEEFGLGAAPPGNPAALPQFVATSTLSNGQVGQNLFLYDLSYRTKFSSNLWGTEANYLFDAYLPDPWMQVRPMIGFRYVDFEEQLQQTGSFNQQGLLPIPLVSVITSDAENHVYVPQIGLRAELNSRWLSLGVEPKFGLGVNRFQDTVVVQRLRSQGDPTIVTTDLGRRLAATGEISVFGKFHVRENFSLTFNYSFVFIDNISRPQSSIYYNDNGAGNPAAIVVRPDHDLMYFQGINFGGEVRF